MKDAQLGHAQHPWPQNDARETRLLQGYLDLGSVLSPSSNVTFGKETEGRSQAQTKASRALLKAVQAEKDRPMSDFFLQLSRWKISFLLLTGCLLQPSHGLPFYPALFTEPHGMDLNKTKATTKKKKNSVTTLQWSLQRCSAPSPHPISASPI